MCYEMTTRCCDTKRIFFQSHLGHVSDFGSGHPGPAVAGDAAEHADAAVADPAAPHHHRQHGRLAAAARAEQPVAEMMAWLM